MSFFRWFRRGPNEEAARPTGPRATIFPRSAADLQRARLEHIILYDSMLLQRPDVPELAQWVKEHRYQYNNSPAHLARAYMDAAEPPAGVSVDDIIERAAEGAYAHYTRLNAQTEHNIGIIEAAIVDHLTNYPPSLLQLRHSPYNAPSRSVIMHYMDTHVKDTQLAIDTWRANYSTYILDHSEKDVVRYIPIINFLMTYKPGNRLARVLCGEPLQTLLSSPMTYTPFGSIALTEAVVTRLSAIIDSARVSVDASRTMAEWMEGREAMEVDQLAKQMLLLASDVAHTVLPNHVPHPSVRKARFMATQAIQAVIDEARAASDYIPITAQLAGPFDMAYDENLLRARGVEEARGDTPARTMAARNSNIVTGLGFYVPDPDEQAMTELETLFASESRDVDFPYGGSLLCRLINVNNELSSNYINEVIEALETNRDDIIARLRHRRMLHKQVTRIVDNIALRRRTAQAQDRERERAIRRRELQEQLAQRQARRPDELARQAAERSARAAREAQHRTERAGRQQAERQARQQTERQARQQAERQARRATRLLVTPEQDAQTVQAYELAAQTTADLYDTAQLSPCEFTAAVSPYLATVIPKMVLFCEKQSALVIPAVLSLYVGQYEQIRINMRWNESDNVTPKPPKYFWDQLMKLPALSKIIVTLAASPAVDVGGITRAVFTKAGEYLKSQLTLNENGYYSGIEELAPGMGQSMRKIMLLSIINKAPLGVPLSHAWLYAVKVGSEGLQKLPLAIVMALQHMDSPAELVAYCNFIDDESLEELVDNDFTLNHMPVLLKRAPVGVKKSERLEWLRRFLIYTLLGVKSQEAIDFLTPDQSEPEMLTAMLRTCTIKDLENLMGTNITLAHMLTVRVEAEANVGISDSVLAQNREFIHRYITDHPENWAKILEHGTASLNVNNIPTFKIFKAHATYPTGHTCFNRIDIKPYTSYDQFAADMDLALSQSGTFELN